MDLSDKEVQLLQGLADGLEYRDIAERIGYTSVPSVKNLCARICDKLGADNKTQAVAMGLRRKLIQ